MNIYKNSSFTLVFGGVDERCDPSLYRAYTSAQLQQHFPFIALQKKLPIYESIFLHQVHGTSGLVVDDLVNVASFPSFVIDGDYLITHRNRIALGAITADCLPIVFYDSDNDVIALAHAGWRGSVAGIAQKVLEEMRREYATDPTHVMVFFGPSAKACCYRVDEKFIEPLRGSPWFNQIIQLRNNGYFFDVPLYNELVLLDHGICASAINRDYNDCTICDSRYCSYRREPKNPFRNVTAVMLSSL